MANNKVTSWLSLGDNNEERPRFKKIHSDIEEGEISSDDDDSNLEKLFRSKEERNRLLHLTEKEREEEIFKRSLEFNDIKSRQKVVRKLNEQKKRDGTRHPGNKKRFQSDVFGRCSDNESILSSSSVDSSSLPIKKLKASPQIIPRQIALDSQKSFKNAELFQLYENRNRKRERLEKTSKEELLKKSIFESDSSDCDEKRINNVDRVSVVSSSSSGQKNEPRDQLVVKSVAEMDDLTKIRVSRHQMENWVHMPFFKVLVKGCFVRVNIGEGPNVVPIYRIAEVVDMIETDIIYDLGSTRTNIGMKLRIGHEITMTQLLFVSNQNFLQPEFDSWCGRVINDGFQLPTLNFIEQKSKALTEYSNFSICNEETMKQVLISKKRFQKGPANIALHKAELNRLKMAAENDGDVIKVIQYQHEIEELNMKAEKLELKRTEGIKNISYINQRNRETTMEHVEKAIELERAERLEWDKKGGDPLDREPTKPVLNYKKKKQERMEKEAQALLNAAQVGAGLTTSDGGFSTTADAEVCCKTESGDAKININNIHDFEVHLDIRTGSGGHHPNHVTARLVSPQVAKAMNISESMLSAISNSLGYVTTTSSPAQPTSQALASSRVLNLQDYKKRKGLI